MTDKPVVNFYQAEKPAPAAASADAAALQAQLDEVTGERDALKKQVEALEANGATPSPLANRDAAIARISGVNRVSDAMAAEIYTALTTPDTEES